MGVGLRAERALREGDAGGLSHQRQELPRRLALMEAWEASGCFAPQDRVMPLFSRALRVPRIPSLAPSAPAASLTVRAPAALPGKPAWRLGALRRGEVSPPGVPRPRDAPIHPALGLSSSRHARKSFIRVCLSRQPGGHLHVGALPTLYCIQHTGTLSSAY